MIGKILVVAALLASGMAALVAEIAVIPGVGIGAAAAALLVFGGVVYAWLSFGAGWGMGSLLIAGASTLAVLRIMPRTKAGKALVLETALGRGAPAAVIAVGAEGVTVTPLRPAGMIEHDGRRIDVVTDGVFIEAGQRVRVVDVQGARVVVAPV